VSIHEERLSIPSGGIQLEAALALPDTWRARALLIVCHPHPLHGGSMDNNVVFALSDAALQEGVGALRFNFRGTGQSGGSYGGGEPETGDVLAALETARGLFPGTPVSLAGYSFGAARAAAASQQSIDPPASLMLVSPPLRSNSDLQLPASGRPVLLISGDQDSVCPEEALNALAATISPAPDRLVIEGADHSWWGYEDQLRDAVAGFLRWHALAGPPT
jgi:alpha/beta superfamily hydrolase